ILRLILMEDQGKSCSKPYDPSTQIEELVGPTTFVSSVEKVPVLMVEGVGISATSIGSSTNSTNSAYGSFLEGSVFSDARTCVSGDSGAHNTNAVPNVDKNLGVDTSFNVANDDLDTVMESMPSEKKSESFSNQPVKNDASQSDGIDGGIPSNESLLLQAVSAPNEVPSSELVLHSEKEFPAKTDAIPSYILSRDICLDTTSDAANDDRDAVAEGMPCKKKTEPFLDQPVESNANESDVADGQMIVDKSLLLQEESTPNKAPSSEVELHSERAFPAETATITGYRPSSATESLTRNLGLASVDFEVDKNATVVGCLEVSCCNSIQTAVENPTQDNEARIKVDGLSHVEAEIASNRDGCVASAEKIFVDEAVTTNNLGTDNAEVRKSSVCEMRSSTSANSGIENTYEENPTQDNKAGVTLDVLYKEAERASSKDGVVAFAEIISVDGTNTSNSLGIHSDEANSCPISEFELSKPVNVANENLFGNAELTVESDAGRMANGITGGYVSSSFSGDATNVITDKLASNVGAVAKDVLLAGAGQKIGTSQSATNEGMFESELIDFAFCKKGESSADAEHISTFTDGIHNIIGQSSREWDAVPIGSIAPPDANIFTKTQGPVNTVSVMKTKGVNISVTSRDEFPSMVPGIFTANATDGGLKFHAKHDAIQDCADDVGQEELAKQDDIQACVEHGGEGVLKQDAIQTSVEYSGGEEFVGQKVRKRFGKKNYIGKVVGFDQETFWYKVKYEDGDEEDLEWEELEPILLHSKGGKTEIRKRKRRSGFRFGEHRKVKRVRRPNGPTYMQGTERTPSIVERGKSVESDDRKGDEKCGLHNEDLSLIDTADRLSSPTRTVQRRHSEELNATKRRKLEEEAVVEHDRVTSSRIRNRLIMESVPRSQSDIIENRVSTRRISASSANNVEAVSGLNADIVNSTPIFHDNVKSESHESSDKNIPAQGGGICIIGRKTKKDFGGQFYEGEVIDFDYKAKYYKVKYEDGDEEELEWSELEPTLVPSDQKPLSFKNMLRARNMAARPKVNDHSTSSKENADTLNQDLALPEGGVALNEKQKSARCSVLEEVKEGLHWKENSSGQLMMPVESIGHIPSPPRPLAAARFASASDADIYEYFSWGEVIGVDKAKCPELKAAKLLPTSSPIVHLVASQHHLAAITAAGQVWLWRNKHGYIHTRCNEWEHIASLEEKGIVLVDIAGPDLDRASSGYEADQEDQVPDPFYLVAIGADGQNFILQGSQPQETVRTYQLSDEPQYPSLKGCLAQPGYSSPESIGQIVQLSVGTVEAPDESPFIGYITDTDYVYIRSATKDYMEEINFVSGYTGKPIKIQCGRVYHAIIMTDDGRAWTWGCGYYHGPTGFSAATCQPAVGTLVGRKVIDVGCYGEDFIALTNDGDVHQWTHAVPNPAAGVYNVPATPLYGRGPCIPHGDKLKQVSIGAGMCAGVTDSGRVHTWRTAMKGGLIGILVSEKEALTPLGHEENHNDTAIVSLGNRTATKVICVAGSLIVVVKKKARGRMGGPRRKKQKNNTESGIRG
ncbi:hypothetical protein KI387_009560, partial [Taxus chinensis]